MPKLSFIRQFEAGPTSELLSIHRRQEQVTGTPITSGAYEVLAVSSSSAAIDGY
jgi:hypothetical protein